MAVVAFIPAPDATAPATPTVPTRPAARPSPHWPPDLETLRFALRLDRYGDAVADMEADEALQRQLDAAVAFADRQAPDAPGSVKTEAAIRFISWLYDGYTPHGNGTGLWRRCGAQGLLAPWTVRRAVLVG